MKKKNNSAKNPSANSGVVPSRAVRTDFSGDFGRDSKNSFSARCVRIALAIPPGKVMTYGMIARAAGGGGQASRSVTGILGKAYMKGEKNIPWHRIVYAGGKVWLSPEHEASRRRLYKKEGIVVDKKGKIQNFRDAMVEV
jgi:methylated-DNA-protein-cysteine methyltransferase-like protein